MNNKWHVNIGLEIHIQLMTKSKLFSNSYTKYGSTPNTQINELDIGIPGTLPLLNEEALNMAIKFGLSVNGEICNNSFFERKNYFYPDLPKGYQISQNLSPIVKNGYIDIVDNEGKTKRIDITRAHLEEDAGKLIHENIKDKFSGIDFNRAGIPLLEIVSSPNLSNSCEAINYLKSIHLLVRYLKICDGNMQEGSFRCDANVSIRKGNSNILGTRTELKNINSFKYIEQAINYEIERQKKILENNGEIIQETRLFNQSKCITESMRLKEEASDYRYFPDPDLLPIIIDKSTIMEIKRNLIELPSKKYKRFKENYSLNEKIIDTIINDSEIADYFEKIILLINEYCKKTEENIKIDDVPKLVSTWIIGEVFSILKKIKEKEKIFYIPAEHLAKLIIFTEVDKINRRTGKKLIEESLIEDKNLNNLLLDEISNSKSTNEESLSIVIKKIILSNNSELLEYKKGKKKLYNFFFGKIMAATKGLASTKKINEILKKTLDESS